MVAKVSSPVQPAMKVKAIDSSFDMVCLQFECRHPLSRSRAKRLCEPLRSPAEAACCSPPASTVRPRTVRCPQTDTSGRKLNIAEKADKSDKLNNNLDQHESMLHCGNSLRAAYVYLNVR